MLLGSNGVFARLTEKNSNISQSQIVTKHQNLPGDTSQQVSENNESESETENDFLLQSISVSSDFSFYFKLSSVSTSSANQRNPHPNASPIYLEIRHLRI